MYLKPLFTTFRMDLFAKAGSLFCSLFAFLLFAGAQPNTTIEVAKPKPYENRTLPAEKTGNSKFPVTKRIYNNTVTRFNYYFNANNKVNDIITRARDANKDDYTRLLPFYDYSLDVTAKDQIDSVIYKCNAGILLHDLRNDWVDNMYVLLGKAYLLRKDFDSATAVFQYINYAYAPKDGDYDLLLGSNSSNTNGVFTVATNEKRSFWKKVTTTRPSRNESFIWQARTYLEQGKLSEAAGLLEILRADPNFPQRLHAPLYEMLSYWFYKQQVYDSAAAYLVKALPNAPVKQSAARWEFLAAQLYALADKNTEANDLYERSIRHTVDPLMEVHARLNMAAIASGKNENSLQQYIDELLKMAKRDKYIDYRDIIYYSAAKLELQRKNYPEAQKLLLKSIAAGNDNPAQKQLAFLLLGDLNYDNKTYIAASRFYDSVETKLLGESDQQRILVRKPALHVITRNQLAVNREDSLQQLALLQPNDREDAVRKVLRQLRKEQGLKEEAALTNASLAANAAPVASDLFGNGGNEFYFLNTSVKTRGAAEFKTRWGNRPNTDNWRRQNAIDRAFGQQQISPLAEVKAGAAANNEPTMESLMKDIPLTDEQRLSAKGLIIKSLLENAVIFQNQLGDYPSAIALYEELLKRYPGIPETEQVLFQLSLAYQKTDAIAKADSVRSALRSNYPSGKYTAQLSAVPAGKQADAATKEYESVYRMFIEGRFAQAREAKEKADKQYGKTYWTPQMLYIESIYYVKQREDSTAIDRLQYLASAFPKTPMAEKALTMIDVLKRRAEIENHLTNLQIERTEDLVTRGVDLNTPVTAMAPVKKDSLGTRLTADGKALDLAPVAKDTVAVIPPLKDKNVPQQTIASAGKDSIAGTKTPQQIKGSGVTATPGATAAGVISNGIYAFNPLDSHYVAIILDKVDPVFVSEGRNAFNRYNQERYSRQRIPSNTVTLDQTTSLVLMGPFTSAGIAVSYIENVKPEAKTRIVPWLPADKYSFIIINAANLEQLKNNKDIAGYRAFMQKIIPE
ncbi:type IX secretion system periplasmic lipoprotein PorW/SprE [Sediminibacterium ginsengisoli]|uniref:Outer membrane protein assembly factor BamD, BamD/ComL family n=1 Tax=Sediminibacterium ginsengisoli TaxID=413434 RepID=A0A1T4QQN1_9BACT|nr:hypothetical protein [Sediminibacterium ginsengisoli]SKA06092.1 Outer membrane protein assembly factor BamD, BamD/ComL family [Sediminibacterium ginsengisoli]